MPVEKTPQNPLSVTYIPPGSVSYRVQNGDDWRSIAKKAGIGAETLIEFNFKTRNPAEVNWYLRRRVGCKKATRDNLNWMFSSDAQPGIIHLPNSPASIPRKKEKPPAPTTSYPDELAAAEAALKKSRRIADSILSPNSPSDLAYWFAELYYYITMYEIQGRNVFIYPAFVMHFIPIFYDLYAEQAERFMKKESDQIVSHWREHFATASARVDPSMIYPYMQAATNSLIAGVSAHIKGDMAVALEQAYRTYAEKYSGVPPFDTYKPDFFAKNKPIFEKVRRALVDELINRGMGLAAFGRSVDPGLAAKIADLINTGMKIDEIYRWREEAWKTAKEKLGQ